MRLRRYLRPLTLFALLVTGVVAAVLWETTRLSATERALVGVWSRPDKNFLHVVEFRPDRTAVSAETNLDGSLRQSTAGIARWRVTGGKMTVDDSHLTYWQQFLSKLGPWTGVIAPRVEVYEFRLSPDTLEFEVPANSPHQATPLRYMRATVCVAWPERQVD